MKEDARDHQSSEVRLDRWLWAARFFKTRQLSVSAIKAGKIEHNGCKAKPSRMVGVGDRLRIRRDQFRYEVEVREVREKRVGAELAQRMYRESDESAEARRLLEEQIATQRRSMRHAEGRPSKKNRRDLERLKREGLL
jgi:ribosome-associated heat shock protein Hsp15